MSPQSPPGPRRAEGGVQVVDHATTALSFVSPSPPSHYQSSSLSSSPQATRMSQKSAVSIANVQNAIAVVRARKQARDCIDGSHAVVNAEQPQQEKAREQARKDVVSPAQKQMMVQAMEQARKAIDRDGYDEQGGKPKSMSPSSSVSPARNPLSCKALQDPRGTRSGGSTSREPLPPVAVANPSMDSAASNQENPRAPTTNTAVMFDARSSSEHSAISGSKPIPEPLSGSPQQQKSDDNSRKQGGTSSIPIRTAGSDDCEVVHDAHSSSSKPTPVPLPGSPQQQQQSQRQQVDDNSRKHAGTSSTALNADSSDCEVVCDAHSSSKRSAIIISSNETTPEPFSGTPQQQQQQINGNSRKHVSTSSTTISNSGNSGDESDATRNKDSSGNGNGAYSSSNTTSRDNIDSVMTVPSNVAVVEKTLNTRHQIAGVDFEQEIAKLKSMSSESFSVEDINPEVFSAISNYIDLVNNFKEGRNAVAAEVATDGSDDDDDKNDPVLRSMSSESLDAAQFDPKRLAKVGEYIDVLRQKSTDCSAVVCTKEGEEPVVLFEANGVFRKDLSKIQSFIEKSDSSGSNDLLAYLSQQAEKNRGREPSLCNSTVHEDPPTISLSDIALRLASMSSSEEKPAPDQIAGSLSKEQSAFEVTSTTRDPPLSSGTVHHKDPPLTCAASMDETFSHSEAEALLVSTVEDEKPRSGLEPEQFTDVSLSVKEKSPNANAEVRRDPSLSCCTVDRKDPPTNGASMVEETEPELLLGSMSEGEKSRSGHDEPEQVTNASLLEERKKSPNATRELKREPSPTSSTVDHKDPQMTCVSATEETEFLPGSLSEGKQRSKHDAPEQTTDGILSEKEERSTFEITQMNWQATNEEGEQSSPYGAADASLRNGGRKNQSTDVQRPLERSSQLAAVIRMLYPLLTGLDDFSLEELDSFDKLVRYSFPLIRGKEPTAVHVSQILSRAKELSISLDAADRFLEANTLLLRKVDPNEPTENDQLLEEDELLLSFLTAVLGLIDSFVKQEADEIGTINVVPSHQITTAEESVEVEVNDGYINKEDAVHAIDEPWWKVAARLNRSAIDETQLQQLETRVSDSFAHDSSDATSSERAQHTNNVEDHINQFWKKLDKTQLQHSGLPPSTPTRKQRSHRPLSGSNSGPDTTRTSSSKPQTSSPSAYDEKVKEAWIRKRKKRRMLRRRMFKEEELSAPVSINAVAAANNILQQSFSERRKHSRLPLLSSWRASYAQRIQNHEGFMGIDFRSLNDSCSVRTYNHPLDDQPWESRIVKQRFLHEQSVSFSRNWFGSLTPTNGNKKVPMPVCRPASMQMPMKAESWSEEWYRPKNPYRDLLKNNSEDSDDEEASWEETPECGKLRNVKLKIGERISRVTPDLTSSLRRSRWRKKHFGNKFPY